jgi:hypothetical protein
MRTLLAVGVLAASAFAHGGVFRPPPQLKPGDIFVPKKGRPTITKADGRAKALMAWEYWWRLNRGPIVRLRARIVDRTVVTGTRKKDDLFDRPALRERLVPVFRKALRDQDQAVRTAAAVALGKLRVMESSRSRISRRAVSGASRCSGSGSSVTTRPSSRSCAARRRCAGRRRRSTTCAAAPRSRSVSAASRAR